MGQQVTTFIQPDKWRHKIYNDSVKKGNDALNKVGPKINTNIKALFLKLWGTPHWWNAGSWQVGSKQPGRNSSQGKVSTVVCALPELKEHAGGTILPPSGESLK